MKPCDKCNGTGLMQESIRTKKQRLVTYETFCTACGGRGTISDTRQPLKPTKGKAGKHEQKR